MLKHFGQARSVSLALGGAGICLLASMGFRGSAPGVGTGAPALERTVHHGWRGNRETDNWNECTDSSGTFANPVPVVLRTHFDGAHALVLQPMSKAEVQVVYKAAFDACFLMDYDEGGLPGGPKRKEWLHDVAAIHDGASETVLQFRPSSKVPKMLTDSLRANEGFFVGDFFNTSTALTFVNTGASGDMEIPPFHSLLLFMGKDASGTMYSALLDLDKFPARHNAGQTKNIRPASVSTMSWQSAPLRRTAFARLSDPRAVARAESGGGVTWLNCAPGSCLAQAYGNFLKGGRLVARDTLLDRPRAAAATQ